jgi:hypothetical protein
VGCGDCVVCTTLATEQLDFLLSAYILSIFATTYVGRSTVHRVVLLIVGSAGTSQSIQLLVIYETYLEYTFS